MTKEQLEKENNSLKQRIEMLEVASLNNFFQCMLAIKLLKEQVHVPEDIIAKASKDVAKDVEKMMLEMTSGFIKTIQ